MVLPKRFKIGFEEKGNKSQNGEKGNDHSNEIDLIDVGCNIMGHHPLTRFVVRNREHEANGGQDTRKEVEIAPMIKVLEVSGSDLFLDLFLVSELLLSILQ